MVYLGIFFRYLPVFGCFCLRLSSCCVYQYIYMNNLYIVMYFRTLIESKPVGFSHISMQAKVSASGLIKEVMDDEFTFIYSDADPGCLSRIPDPNFFLSRIQGQKDSGSV
jgi:hypothetical protein